MGVVALRTHFSHAVGFNILFIPRGMAIETYLGDIGFQQAFIFGFVGQVTG